MILYWALKPTHWEKENRNMENNLSKLFWHLKLLILSLAGHQSTPPLSSGIVWVSHSYYGIVQLGVWGEARQAVQCVHVAADAEREALVHMHSSVWINKSIWCCSSVLSLVTGSYFFILSLFLLLLLSFLTLPRRHPAFSSSAPTSPQCNFPSLWLSIAFSLCLSLSLTTGLSIIQLMDLE